MKITRALTVAAIVFGGSIGMMLAQSGGGGKGGRAEARAVERAAFPRL